MSQTQAPRAKVNYFIQNLYTTLLMLVFIRTSPKQEEAEFAANEVDAVIGEYLKNGDLMSHVNKSSHFEIVEGKIRLTGKGQALAIHKSSSLQRDAFMTNPRAYLNGTNKIGEFNRPFMDQIGIFGHVFNEFALIAQKVQQSAEGMLPDEAAELVEAWNATTEIMSNVLANLTPSTNDEEE